MKPKKGTFILVVILALMVITCSAGRTTIPQFIEYRNTVVYATPTGASYHNEECRHARSGFAVSLYDAVRFGLEPCFTCEPPQVKPQDYNQISIYPKVLYMGITASYQVRMEDLTTVKAVNVVDGDTIDLVFDDDKLTALGIARARLIGVDTPEKDEPGFDQATQFTQAALTGETLFIGFDRAITDRYGRLLVYAYTTEGILHNLEIIKAGMGNVMTDYDFYFMDEFVSSLPLHKPSGLADLSLVKIQL